MPKHSSHIVELAKRGAEVRLHELMGEAKNLIKLFPHLRDSFDKDELPLPFIMAKGAGRVRRITPTRRRRRMSAAARAKIAAAQKETRQAQGREKVTGRRGLDVRVGEPHPRPPGTGWLPSRVVSMKLTPSMPFLPSTPSASSGNRAASPWLQATRCSS